MSVISTSAIFSARNNNSSKLNVRYKDYLISNNFLRILIYLIYSLIQFNEDIWKIEKMLEVKESRVEEREIYY